MAIKLKFILLITGLELTFQKEEIRFSVYINAFIIIQKVKEWDCIW